ncbi:acyl-CoA N-acyltransferases super family protein [Striga asiatica]|uniref:Acyl-CoA N-acyltransferases super family protein n=1 Tax=Striga asiatica TaxID=4170 RepID=A0A5A7PYZ1_STRAF|nr:acyl-CoA N-acyltransferases super family protein [Striga asiatica]
MGHHGVNGVRSSDLFLSYWKFEIIANVSKSNFESTLSNYPKSARLTLKRESLLFTGNCNSLALQSSAVIPSPLPTTRQSLNVPNSSVALYILQPFDCHRIKSPLTKISPKNNNNNNNNNKISYD